MREAENLRARIGLPPVSQIGILVRDLDQTARLYSEIFGIPEFYTYDLDVANHWYYGEKAPVKLRMGKALWGQVEIELIQHVEGDKSLFPGWLAEHGEGLNHLGFEVDARQYDLAVEIMKDLGIKQIYLLTNNPQKLEAIEHSDIEIIGRVPLIIEPKKENRSYLKTKRELMGHLLNA